MVHQLIPCRTMRKAIIAVATTAATLFTLSASFAAPASATGETIISEN